MRWRIVLATGRARSAPTLALLLLFLAGGADRATAEVDLGAARAFDVDDAASDMALGDFDEDGLVDAVLLSREKVLVHLGVTPVGYREVVTLSRPEWGGDPIVADFDSDGHEDVLVRPLFRGAISIHHGDGTGRFGDPRLIRPSPDHVPEQVAAADFDQDGDLDIAVSNSALRGIHILLGTGDGGFTEAPFVSLGEQPVRMRAGRLDADGIPDLALLTGESTLMRASILAGDGLGGFRSAGSIASDSRIAVMETGDLDRDGRDEIIVASTTNDGLVDVHTLRILATDEFGAVSVASERSSESQIRQLLPVDSNGDGNLDIALQDDSLRLVVGDGTRRPATVRPLIEDTGARKFDFRDVNGDGALDVVWLLTLNPHVAVALATGNGRFEGPREFPIDGLPGRSLVADFDADGFDDIVTVLRTSGLPSAYAIVILLGLGGGGFSEPATLGFPFVPQDIAAGDFDHDGTSDLVICSPVAGSVSSRVSLWLGGGAGGFTPSAERILSTRWGAAFAIREADVNADGDSDVIVQTQSRDGVYVVLGDGRGGFVSDHRLADSTYPIGVTSGDFDEDGADEVVHIAGARLEIHAGSATLEFAQLEPVPIGFGARVVMAGDVDGDNNRDLVVLGYEQDDLVALLGDGTGSFVPVRSCLLGSHIDSAALVDFDGDGLLDIVAANSGILRAASGDGRGGFGQCVRYAAHGDGGVAAGDIDQDGHIDVVGSGRTTGKLSIVRNRAFLHPRFACWRGTVNAGAGAITDVLFVNDSAGGARRTVPLLSYEPLVVSVAPPPSATTMAPFAIFAWRGRPGADSFRDLPFGIGTTCLPTPIHGGTPNAVWNNTGRIALGTPTRPSTAAPSTLLQLPSGVGRRATFVLQGVIADPASAGTRPASVTNAVLVEVR